MNSKQYEKITFLVKSGKDIESIYREKAAIIQSRAQ